MAGKELVKSQFDKDFDDTIDTVMPMMMMMMVMLVMIPMLPVVQSAQQYFQSQQFEGQSDPRTLHATQKPQHIVIANPWIGAYFVNDGPDSVQIKINDEESESYLMNFNETITLSRAGAENRIYAVYYRCSPGETAAVRIFAVF